jgi:hypothetical protein
VVLCQSLSFLLLLLRHRVLQVKVVPHRRALYTISSTILRNLLHHLHHQEACSRQPSNLITTMQVLWRRHLHRLLAHNVLQHRRKAISCRHHQENESRVILKFLCLQIVFKKKLLKKAEKFCTVCFKI